MDKEFELYSSRDKPDYFPLIFNFTKITFANRSEYKIKYFYYIKHHKKKAYVQDLPTKLINTRFRMKYDYMQTANKPFVFENQTQKCQDNSYVSEDHIIPKD